MALPRWKYRFRYSSIVFIVSGFTIAALFPFWSKETLISVIVVAALVITMAWLEGKYPDPRW
jgi:hypothetical protein